MRQAGENHTRTGFTLVEVMIVVAIIGLLAAMGIPSFMKARAESKAATMTRAMKVLSEAILIHAMETGTFPVDTATATVPVGMSADDFEVDWTEPTQLRGFWDYDAAIAECFNCGAAISIFGAGQDPNSPSFLAVDRMIDDGDLTAGDFRASTDRYTYIIE